MKRIFITASALFFPFTAAYAGCAYNCDYLTNGEALLMFSLLMLFFAGMGGWGAIEAFREKKTSSLLFCALLAIVNLTGLIAMYFFKGYGFLGAVVGTGLLMFLSPKGV